MASWALAALHYDQARRAMHFAWNDCTTIIDTYKVRLFDTVLERASRPPKTRQGASYQGASQDLTRLRHFPRKRPDQGGVFHVQYATVFNDDDDDDAI